MNTEVAATLVGLLSMTVAALLCYVIQLIVDRRQ